MTARAATTGAEGTATAGPANTECAANLPSLPTADLLASAHAIARFLGRQRVVGGAGVSDAAVIRPPPPPPPSLHATRFGPASAPSLATRAAAVLATSAPPTTVAQAAARILTEAGPDGLVLGKRPRSAGAAQPRRRLAGGVARAAVEEGLARCEVACRVGRGGGGGGGGGDGDDDDDESAFAPATVADYRAEAGLGGGQGGGAGGAPTTTTATLCADPTARAAAAATLAAATTHRHPRAVLAAAVTATADTMVAVVGALAAPARRARPVQRWRAVDDSVTGGALGAAAAIGVRPDILARARARLERG